MYEIQKTFEIAGSHKLNLNYESKCARVHGHNWIVTVFCRRDDLDENGMVVDFSEVKKQVMDVLDHRHLNDILPENPTAENMARFILKRVPYCYRVWVQESEGNVAICEL